MFLYLKCCFSEKLEQRPVDDMQKYADNLSPSYNAWNFLENGEKTSGRGVC